jgi:hypothetical protein
MGKFSECADVSNYRKSKNVQNAMRQNIQKFGAIPANGIEGKVRRVNENNPTPYGPTF